MLYSLVRYGPFTLSRDKLVAVVTSKTSKMPYLLNIPISSRCSMRFDVASGMANALTHRVNRFVSKRILIFPRAVL